MSRAPQRAVLALGSNLGDRLGMLQGALDALGKMPGVDVVAVSGVYETAPVGGPPGQDPYLNAVILVDTTLPASVLLERCLAVEGALGRHRTERWGPRTLDIDVITYDDQPKVKLVPIVKPPHKRVFGQHRGHIWMRPDFDNPLPDDFWLSGSPTASSTCATTCPTRCSSYRSHARR